MQQRYTLHAEYQGICAVLGLKVFKVGKTCFGVVDVDAQRRVGSFRSYEELECECDLTETTACWRSPDKRYKRITVTSQAKPGLNLTTICIFLVVVFIKRDKWIS